MFILHAKRYIAVFKRFTCFRLRTNIHDLNLKVYNYYLCDCKHIIIIIGELIIIVYSVILSKTHSRAV